MCRFYENAVKKKKKNLHAKVGSVQAKASLAAFKWCTVSSSVLKPLIKICFSFIVDIMLY